MAQLQTGAFVCKAICRIFFGFFFKVMKMVMKMTIMAMRMTWNFGETYVKLKD